MFDLAFKLFQLSSSTDTYQSAYIGVTDYEPSSMRLSSRIGAREEGSRLK